MLTFGLVSPRSTAPTALIYYNLSQYLENGIVKPAQVERLQPPALLSSGQTDEKKGLVVDRVHDDQTQPAANFGPAQAAPKAVGRPAGAQKPPRDTRHL